MVFCCLDFYFYFKILQLYYYIMVASFFASWDSPLENVCKFYPIPSGNCSNEYSVPSGTRSEGTGKARKMFSYFHQLPIHCEEFFVGVVKTLSHLSAS